MNLSIIVSVLLRILLTILVFNQSVSLDTGEWVLEKDNNGKSNVLSSPGLFGTFPYIDKSRNYAAIIFVRNLQFRNRQKIYSEIRSAINETIRGY